ncbi:MAG: DegT/DnrJ/EryC1/StrS family aminotransferase [Thermogemmatispora sp.]|uniref:Aminotransferase DegT n=1 Tax=Thermogemmatispora aurantia TaxID=2045279 RepID=A0A5J4KFL2_9CHLR|nr:MULTISPECIES: DegT/DnrJ/EryC1/StrS family aminotransferase [Thermogemmatispora]MBE3566456.1 DegT/DnrJ/EryC1/StrS family aminotransferase [Thermogemmatispora sp.]GER85240.1 aminotransferase DegT [Thermogemmatispora aurantia]
MIPIARPLLGAEEEAAIREVLTSGLLAQGKYVAAFEQRFAELCQVGAAIAVSSGTAALHLALLAHDIGPGDEVITTAFSFAATANAILLVGATPVFVDIEPETYTLDPTQVELALSERTRAILPVHLYGHPCDLGRLLPLVEAHKLILLEDACQAHASSFAGKPVGSFGTGCFSFYATKNMTTGEGGMITSDDPEVAARLRLLRNHGQASRYHQIGLGYNLRMTDLQGALGLVQLAKLEEFTQRRIANATYLNQHLAGIVQTPITRPGCRHTYHQYTIRVPAHRDEIAAELHRRGIATAVHYPVPIHQQPFYRSQASRFYVVNPERQQRVRGDSPLARLPETERAAREVLSLPVHPALTQDDLETIAREVIALCS